MTTTMTSISFAVMAIAFAIAAPARAADPLAPAGKAAAPPVASVSPAVPSSPPPQQSPPVPQAANPPPPPYDRPLEPPPGAVVQQPAPAVAVPAPQPPPGQWVYTAQYGWLWMPYGQPYTYVVPDAALSYMFVFYPRFGWRWVVAPWVLGFGPAPHWGVVGPSHFIWYRHPFRIGARFHGRGWVRVPHVRRVHVGRGSWRR
jgi:hypothetical protein